MAQNTTDGDKHYFANDGTDWRSTAGPVSSKEAREVDAELDEDGRNGAGPSATNEVRLGGTIVEGSEESNNEQYADEDESEGDAEDE